MRLHPSVFLPLSSLAFALTGCAFGPSASSLPQPGVAISGTVFGGQQPIVGSHIYVLAANTTGYGNASRSLLTNGVAGTDAIGGYVLSGAGGSFSVTGGYTCSPGDQVYLYAAGGTVGTVTLSAATLMAVLGSCPTGGTFALTNPIVGINEVSTVAAAYSLAGYATDGTHVSSSGTTQALTGVKNAFATAANLVDLRSASALTVTPGNTGGTVPQAEINTLANILAACINSTGASSSACSSLFSNALSAGTRPSDTATAAINIAHNPGANVSNLFTILNGIGAAFSPSLSAAPHDFSLAIVWSFIPNQIAIDASGNIWGSSVGLMEYSNTGILLSPSTGFIGGGLTSYPTAVAIDPAGSVWTTNPPNYALSNAPAYNLISKFNSDGTSVSGRGFTGGGLNYPGVLTIDGSGNVWVGNGDGPNLSAGAGTVSAFNTAGVPLRNSPFAAGDLTTVNGIAADSTGSIWVSSLTQTLSGFNYITTSSLTKLSSAGAIVATPLVNSTTYDYTAYAVDASNSIWGSAFTSPSNEIFKVTSTGTQATSSPFAGNSALQQCLQMAVDGSGNVWCASDDDSIAEISNTGTPISPDAGYTIPNFLGPQWLAIDSSGNVWSTGGYTSGVNGGITGLTIELVGAAAPVVTPTSLAIQLGKLGARP